MPDLRLGIGEEPLGMLDALHGIQNGFRRGVEMCGQAFDLLDVEHSVSLHEGDFLRRLLAGLLVGFGAGDAVRVDNQAAMLAFADMGA